MANQINQFDIVSWSISASMETGLSATIEVANKNNVYYSDSYLHKLITLTTNINGTQKIIFKGHIVGYDPNYELGAKHNLAFSCQSIFNRLSRKPINTEKYDTVSFSTLIGDILTQYNGYSAATYDLTYGNPSGTFTNICVNEPSTIEAIKKLAEASYQEIFVNLEGKLVTEQYTALDETPLSEVTLPPEYVHEAKVTYTDEIAFSTVRVRGGYKANIIQPDAFIYSFTYLNTFPNPYPTAQILVPYATSAPSECFENAAITSSDPNFVSAYVSNVTNVSNFYVLDVQAEVEAPYIATGSHDIIITVTPAAVEILSTNAFGTQITNLNKGTTRRNLKKIYWESHPQRTKGSTDFRGMKPPDEKEVNRYDVYVQDVSLHALVGTLWTELDNVYIPDEASCELIGERYLQEYKQNRKIWEITLAPYLDINLNTRLTFQVPDLGTQIIGVVREINFEYQASNNSLIETVRLEELQ